MNDLTLYVDANYDSPWAMGAFVALEEKGLPYTLKTAVLSKKETFGPAFPGRTHKVPTLVHGDFVLSESSAIAEYLAETFPHPKHPRLFPEDLKERAICREVMGWLRTDFMPLREERPTVTLWFKRADKPLSEKAAAALEKLVAGVAPLVASQRTTLFAQWCLADAELAVMLQRANLNGSPLPAHLKAYAEANWRRPSLMKWHGLPRGAEPI